MNRSLTAVQKCLSTHNRAALHCPSLACFSSVRANGNTAPADSFSKGLSGFRKIGVAFLKVKPLGKCVITVEGLAQNGSRQDRCRGIGYNRRSGSLWENPAPEAVRKYRTQTKAWAILRRNKRTILPIQPSPAIWAAMR